MYVKNQIIDDLAVTYTSEAHEGLNDCWHYIGYAE